MSKPRLRFAPSPTGYLHVGVARTALFNWLYARKVGGTFLLRIEDTDKARSTDEYTRVILDGLKWLGLDWDEEPVFQGARVERHRDVADRLLAEGHAYMEEGAIRFRMPKGEIAWTDTVHGPITFKGEDLKDWVILRSDRTPTYNFSVVVDDVDMRISQVLRGDDHISNTPKQIAVYRALGAALPAFGHTPMIHGMDGKKLSKRHGATAVADYQQLGMVPGAMRNFLALLGWSPGGDRELFFDVTEMIDAFSLEAIQRSSAMFDMKKLEWMNGQHLHRMSPDELLPLVSPVLESQGVKVAAAGAERIARAIRVVLTRSRTTLEIAKQVAVRLDARFIDRDAVASKAIAEDPAAFRKAVQAVAKQLAGVPDQSWEPGKLEAQLRALAESLEVPAHEVFQPVRIALTGLTVSEPVHDLLWSVGKKEAVDRLEAAGTG